MKWFANMHDVSEELRREPFDFDALGDKHRKSALPRLSASFTESRPWNFVSSQVSDHNKSVSRKRRSLFGHRSLTTSSVKPEAESSPPGHTNMTNTSFFDALDERESGPSVSRPKVFSRSRTSLSGPESWRSSIFTRRTSTRLSEFGNAETEPGSSLARLSSRISHARPSTDHRAKSDEFEHVFYSNLKKNGISSPFNFQHITHTQKDSLPELESVTDRELIPKFLAASAHQAPQGHLRDIYTHSPPVVLDLNRSLPSTPSEAAFAAPVSEVGRPLSQDGRIRSFTQNSLSSTERVCFVTGEQREPPAMVHPAFRGTSASSTPVYELPGMSLDSVPEEVEHASPMRPARSTRPMAGSPCTSPYFVIRNASPTPFPAGNAFAQAHKAIGTEPRTCYFNDRTPVSGQDSIPSLTSGESWENEVDLLYSFEAESTCDFDWASVKSSLRGSESSPSRRDSAATSSVRTISVHEDTTTRPSSRKNSTKAYAEEGTFHGFDGAVPFCTTFQAQKFGFATPATRPHSAISTSTELKPILEMKSSTTLTETLRVKHNRSASYSEQRPLAPKRMARWSIASPECLSEDVKCRQPTFTKNIASPLVGRVHVSAPRFPPPAAPLPELPIQKATGILPPRSLHQRYVRRSLPLFAGPQRHQIGRCSKQLVASCSVVEIRVIPGP
ncbi:hypothetical protein BDV97DRAFT_224210 [Delphinella strobiligena]|nr:hypothetical protein BDV97DRAFT_224210 [Delphinella strobiligena]